MPGSPLFGWICIIFAAGGFVLVFGRRLAHWVEWPPWGMWTVGVALVTWALGVAWDVIGPSAVVKIGIAGAFALVGYAWFLDRGESRGDGRAPDRQ